MEASRVKISVQSCGFNIQATNYLFKSFPQKPDIVIALVASAVTVMLWDLVKDR
jgi:hypothetical protein